jgi:hypothetical protein
VFACLVGAWTHTYTSVVHVVRSGFEDWSIINQICDLSVSSDICALQANLTLTGELRAATTDHRLLRVARLWAIMLRSGGEQFVEYNASPASNFLEAVEDVTSRRSDSGAGARLLRVLGSAVHDFAGTDPMHPYAVLWVKVKHPGQPSMVSTKGTDNTSQHSSDIEPPRGFVCRIPTHFSDPPIQNRPRIPLYLVQRVPHQFPLIL